MRVGVFAFVTDRTMAPGEFATEIEARGLDSLFLPEHSHIPVARTTAYPEVYGGGTLPEFYKRTYDPFVAASFAAAHSREIQVGTGICLVALRDPVHTAKQVASLDLLSGGRFVFGVGFGWNTDEFVTHRVDFATRHRRVRESILLMKEIWTSDVAEFAGEFATLRPSWSWPKPAQRPHPPVYLGGNGPLTMRHAAEWADVWYPTPPASDPQLARSIPAFRRLVEDAGRDPGTVEVAVSPGEVDASLLGAFRDNGVAHVTAEIRAGTRDEALRKLDRLVADREKTR